MGTRNLTILIDKNNKIKIAQYGQWDGYPSGEGLNVLEFARSKSLMKSIEENLCRIKFINDNDTIKKYVEEYDLKVDGWGKKDDRNETDKYWFENLISRDIGSHIFENIIKINETLLPKEHDNTIYINNEIKFLQDSLFCEWAYCINLNTQKLMVFKGFNTDKTKEHELAKTDIEEVNEIFSHASTKYYGCTLVKEYDLSNLPTNEQFLEDLKNN